MRRWLVCAPMILLTFLLGGCHSTGGAETRALDMRNVYIGMTGCSGQVDIQADYGSRVYDYTVDFSYESGGETVLTFTAPQEVAGITARSVDGNTYLEFDGVRLETGALSPDGLTPLDALPALLTCAREGYITTCGVDETGGVLTVVCRDPTLEAGLGLETVLYFNSEDYALTEGEIYWDGSRVVHCVFQAFGWRESG